MNKKLLYTLRFATTFAVIAGLIAMVVLYFQPRVATAKSVSPSSNFNENLVQTTTNTFTAAYPLVQEVNGIKIEVTGTAIEDEYFTADVCYDFPSKKTDYAFTLGGQTQKSMMLTTADETILIYSWKIISGYNQDKDGNFQGNCARLYFPISPVTNLDNLTLTISRMSTPLSDIPDCDKAQKKLDDEKKKIKVKCNNGGGFQVSEKPDDLSEEEAREVALEAFIDIVDGPWVFKLK